MFTTILVPIDIAQSASGTAALSLAADVAKIRGGKLVLFNVVEELPGYVVSQIPEEITANAVPRAESEIMRIAEGLGLRGSVEIVVRKGHAGREILSYAEEVSADLIVVASHDPGLADYFLGSVAGHVVRHAHCSVLVGRNLAG